MTAWMTIPEAAEYLRAKNSRTIREALRDGELTTCTYGKNQIRIDATSSDAWLRSKPYEPKATA